MKKSIAAPFLAAFPPFVRSSRTKTYGYIAIILLVGCAVLDTHPAKLDQKQLRDLEPDLLLALIVQAFAVQAQRRKCENSHKDFVRSRPQTVHGQTVDRVLSIRSFS